MQQQWRRSGNVKEGSKEDETQFPTKKWCISQFHPLPLRLMYFSAVVFESHPVLVLCREFTENSVVLMGVCAHSQFSCFKKNLFWPPTPQNRSTWAFLCPAPPSTSYISYAN
jgi:hypothetical protein